MILNEGEFKSNYLILDNKTILDKGEVFEEVIVWSKNKKGEYLHKRAVGDGITEYKDLPKEEYYRERYDDDGVVF